MWPWLCKRLYGLTSLFQSSFCFCFISDFAQMKLKWPGESDNWLLLVFVHGRLYWETSSGDEQNCPPHVAYGPVQLPLDCCCLWPEVPYWLHHHGNHHGSYSDGFCSLCCGSQKPQQFHEAMIYCLHPLPSFTTLMVLTVPWCETEGCADLQLLTWRSSHRLSLSAAEVFSDG